MTDRDPIYTRASVYEEGDRTIYRASSLGNCIGALVRSRLGVTGSPPPDSMQARYDEGTQYESDVLARGLGVDWVEMVDPNHLSVYGKVVESAGDRAQVETELAWSNKVVRCHPDAIVVRGDTLRQWVCEVKFLGDAMFAEAKRDFYAFMNAHQSYKWQASIEHLSTGLPLLYVIGEKDLVEVDGERVLRGVGEVLVTEVDADRLYSLTDVKMRVAEVEGWVARGEMPACPLPLMYPCAYWADHDASTTDKVEITDEALVAWVDVYAHAKTAHDQATKDLEFAKGAVHEQMAELHLTSGRCAGFDIAVVADAAKGSVSWSKWAKDVKKKYPEVDLSEDEYRGQPTRGYLRITEVT